MKVFLAWSGKASEELAAFMHEWLQSVVQAVEPFMSSKDIRQGQRWASEIGAKLAEVDFALLCLTPTNLMSRWIHFEAGAVSKNIEKARVSALLLDVKPTQIEFPLQQFQHTALIRTDLWKLVQDLNGLCPAPLSEAILKKSFDRSFGEVEEALARIRTSIAEEQKGHAEPKRSTDAILTDLLATQQGIVTRLDAIDARARRTSNETWHDPVFLKSGGPPRGVQLVRGSAGRALFLRETDENGVVTQTKIDKLSGEALEEFEALFQGDMKRRHATDGQRTLFAPNSKKTGPNKK